MSLLGTIYESSPRPLRVAYANAYGLRTRARLRQWNSLIEHYTFTESMSRDDQVRYVDRRLKKTLLHALTNVPFYRPYQALIKDLETRSAFDVLRELPLIDKTVVNRDPDSFLAMSHRRSVPSRTSGTTGTPFTVYLDPEANTLGDALWWRRTLWAGYQPGDWIARLVGDPVVPLRETTPRKPWIISHTDRRIYLSTFHLNAETAHAIGNLLRRRQPQFLMGYPSSLEILCSFLKDADFRMDWDLKHVLFSSEPMHEHRQRLIEEVFGVDIRGVYGSGEKVVSAAQCEAGLYHLSLVDGYIEGQFGIVAPVQPTAATTLVNRAMPLIRYQIGDMIRTCPEDACPCGRTLPIMSPVITKHEDWLITPSGRKISPSAVVWAFIHQDIADIRSGQVVQEDADLVRVYLNTDEETFLKYRDTIASSMDKVFFHEMRIELVRTDSIHVTSAGKSRFIMNRYHGVQTP